MGVALLNRHRVGFLSFFFGGGIQENIASSQHVLRFISASHKMLAETPRALVFIAQSSESFGHLRTKIALNPIQVDNVGHAVHRDIRRSV